MTRIEDVFSVDIERTLDSDLLLQLLASGTHSPLVSCTRVSVLVLVLVHLVSVGVDVYVDVDVVRAGYSRFPVYQGERHNILSMLTVKELALCDPDVPIKVQQLCNYFQHTPIKARAHALAHAHLARYTSSLPNTPNTHCNHTSTCPSTRAPMRTRNRMHLSASSSFHQSSADISTHTHLLAIFTLCRNLWFRDSHRLDSRASTSASNFSRD